MEQKNRNKENCCSNNKDIKLTETDKRVLLQLVLDDVTYSKLTKKDINEAFEVNIANIIIASRGEF